MKKVKHISKRTENTSCNLQCSIQPQTFCCHYQSMERKGTKDLRRSQLHKIIQILCSTFEEKVLEDQVDPKLSSIKPLKLDFTACIMLLALHLPGSKPLFSLLFHFQIEKAIQAFNPFLSISRKLTSRTPLVGDSLVEPIHQYAQRK